MDLKQISFYHGVLEFFSILLPGFVITLVYYIHHKESIIGYFMIGDDFQSFYFNLVFILISYMTGQAIFQVGSKMDHLTYDKFSKIIFIKNKKYIDYISAYRRVNFKNFGKQSELKNKNQFKYLNNFQWSLSFLRHYDKVAYNEVEKIMADSKFFRAIFATTLLYLAYYSSIHFATVFSNIFILSCVIYLGLHIYTDKYSKKVEALENDEIEEERLEKKLQRILKVCLILGIVLYMTNLILFCTIESPYRMGQFSGSTNLFELNSSSNIMISLISVLSLVLYFRIRNKCILKVYKYVIYNLDLKKSESSLIKETLV